MITKKLSGCRHELERIDLSVCTLPLPLPASAAGKLAMADYSDNINRKGLHSVASQLQVPKIHPSKDWQHPVILTRDESIS